MATAIDFPERNDYLGKPPSTTDNQVYALPICRLVTHIPGPTDQDPPVKSQAHISFWQLSDEEIEEVIKNRGVYLKVIGVTTYPLSIHGNKPIYTEGELADEVFTKEQVKEAWEKMKQKKNN